MSDKHNSGGLDRPNYTQIPNLILDDALPFLSKAELKVVLAIARNTFGYHEKKTSLRLIDLARITGLSRQSVLNAIDGSNLSGWVNVDKTGEIPSYKIGVQNLDSELKSKNWTKSGLNFGLSTDTTPIKEIKEKEKERYSGLEKEDSDLLKQQKPQKEKPKQTLRVRVWEQFERPFPGDEFKEAWVQFWDMREDSMKKKKKKIQPRAVKMLINRLKDISKGNEKVATSLLDKSIEKGWDSVYPPDNGGFNRRSTVHDTTKNAAGRHERTGFDQ